MRDVLCTLFRSNGPDPVSDVPDLSVSRNSSRDVWIGGLAVPRKPVGRYDRTRVRVLGFRCCCPSDSVQS